MDMSELKKTIVNKHGLYPNVEGTQALMEQPTNYPIHTPQVGSSKLKFEFKLQIEINSVCIIYLWQSLAQLSVQLAIPKYKPKSVMKLVRRHTCYHFYTGVALCFVDAAYHIV